jgi:hypothetical protein
MPLRTPRVKKRTALLRTLKQIFRSHRSRPISEVIVQINPILRARILGCKASIGFLDTTGSTNVSSRALLCSTEFDKRPD